jgi:hypothetical protein
VKKLWDLTRDAGREFARVTHPLHGAF